MFEYRLTLPAYLEAIAIRLIVLLALEGEIKVTRRSEIASIATQLEEYYNKIRAGIVTIRPPRYLEFTSGPITVSAWDRGEALDPPPLLGGDLHTVSRPYGAVERYSMFAAVDSWPRDFVPQPGTILPDSFEGLGGRASTAYRRHGQRFVAPRSGQRAGYSDVESAVDGIPKCSDQCPQSQ